MQTNEDVTAVAKRKPRVPPILEDGNGVDGSAAPQSVDMALILASLQTMRDGDFSVRLPVAWTGLKGKIADTFNDIIGANERMASELRRVGQAIGKEGRTRERTRFQ